MPKSTEYGEAKEIFTALLDIELPREQIAFIDRTCGKDTKLREEVETLIAAHDEAGSFMSQAASDVLDPSFFREQPGTQIGNYTIGQMIGEGAFGVVYQAEQVTPFRRQVALKIVKPGMDSQELLARFEAERQALALMDHTNISKVFDAGVTDQGRPYFVMELVEGMSLTKYCDENCLSIHDRLQLFLSVCQAVQHAHLKGIIHRDLKPSNVLVSREDGQAVAKIIDFGIAKAIDQRLIDRLQTTAIGQMVGTPAYMSPEQANGSDIDTRSDIFSLGVLLHELITGHTPIDQELLQGKSVGDIQQLIISDSSIIPSARLSTISEKINLIAKHRKTDPGRLRNLLRGDLDCILMKALDIDRDRRYETASSFALDLQRYLRFEPIEASFPSKVYRLRKYIRRNRISILSFGSIGLTLLIASVFSTIMAINARSEHIIAVDAQIIAEESQKNEAEQRIKAENAQVLAETERDRFEKEHQIAKQEEARAIKAEEKSKQETAISQAIVDFLLKDILIQNQPSNSKNKDIKLRTVLDNASENVEKRFEDQPRVAEQIHRTIGRAYYSLDEIEKAIKHLNKSWFLSSHNAELSNDTFITVGHLSMAYNESGQYTKAMILIEEAIEMANDAESIDSHIVPYLRQKLVDSYIAQGQLTKAESILRSLHDPSSQLTDKYEASRRYQLATLYLESNKRSLGKKLLQQVLEFYQSTSSEHRNSDVIIKITLLLATIEIQQGDVDSGVRSLRELIKITQDSYSQDHELFMLFKLELADGLRQQGMFTEADALLDSLKSTSPNDPFLIHILIAKLKSSLSQEKYRELEIAALEAIEKSKQIVGPEHRFTVRATQLLVDAQLKLGKDQLAINNLESIFKIVSRNRGIDSYHSVFTLLSLGEVHMKTGDTLNAEKVLLQVIEHGSSHKQFHGRALFLLRKRVKSSKLSGDSEHETFLRNQIAKHVDEVLIDSEMKTEKSEDVKK